MKIFFLSVSLLMTSIVSFSQDLSKFNAYRPAEDATAAIAKAVKEAKANGKHVFVQVGGNWCIWCMRFDNAVETNSSLDSLVKSNYVVYHLNYSKENKNEKVLAKYAYPQRFGFPVFLILDGNGKLLHTQNSSYLEQGKGYNSDTIKGFLNDWAPAALDPQQYKEQ